MRHTARRTRSSQYPGRTFIDSGVTTNYSIWSYDHVCRPIWSFCSCLHVCFSCFCVLLTLCVVVLFRWHFIDIFSCIAASLFNKLTYLLTTVDSRCVLPVAVAARSSRRCLTSPSSLAPRPLSAFEVTDLTLAASSDRWLAVCSRSISSITSTHTQRSAPALSLVQQNSTIRDTIRDAVLTRNQKADISQLNLPHGTNNWKAEKQKK